MNEDGASEPAADTSEATVPDTAPAAPQAPRHIGQMLADRREHAGLTVADVVARLKIPGRLINAIEAGRWEEVGTPAILRGFVRVYARALDLDPTPLVDGLPRQPEPSATLSLMPTMAAKMPTHQSRGGMRWMFGMVMLCLVVVAAALSIGWLGTHSFKLPDLFGPKTPSAPVAADSDGTTQSAPVEINTSPSTLIEPAKVSPSDPTSPTATVAVPEAGSNAPVASNVTPDNPRAALFLHSSQDSWIEVASADGKVLLKGIVPANENRSIDVDGKLSVVVGNVRGVTLSRRGAPVDLTPYAKGGNVARVTLD